jgi:hypothetical protein
MEGSAVGRLRRVVVGVVTGGLTALCLTLPAVADVGTGQFSVSSAAPGDAVEVTLDRCTSPASDVRISLRAEASSAAPHDVAPTDTDTIGTFRIVVPDLDPGTYELEAACPKSGQFGFYGATLRVTGLPNTSTADAVVAKATGGFPASVLAAVAAAWTATALGALIHRRRTRR